MDYIIWSILIIESVVIFGIISVLIWIWNRNKNNTQQFEISKQELNAIIKVKENENTLLYNEKTELCLKHQEDQEIRIKLEKSISTLESDKKNLLSQIKNLTEVEQSIHLKLEDLLRKTYDQSHDRIVKTSKEQWNYLINPLKKEMDQLNKTIVDTYEKELRESMSLKNYIDNMSRMYEKMSSQTDSLTKALKGDSKSQGDWGEMILERILESAGLIEKIHYEIQGKSLRFKTEEGKSQRPDVIIHLPQDKHIIIDSKVSLKAYEKYFSSQTKEEKQNAETKLLNSIEKHIKILSKKNYKNLYKIKSPDYVLMFIPNDGIFALAVSLNKDIYRNALEKGVSLVSPSFLLPCLRLVQNIWQREKENKNAMKIAEEAGKLCDKFVGFTQNLYEAKEKMNKANHSLEDAVKQLSTGQASIVSKIENLQKLGARTKEKNEKVVENLIESAEL